MNESSRPLGHTADHQPSLAGPRGQAVFAFGTEREGWHAFDVVRFASREGIGTLYELDIVLSRKASEGRVDLDALLGQRVTFRIRLEGRWRAVHGIVAEAEELECTRSLSLYRVLLTPSLWRATQRKHCRTFVERSLREIVSFVLENRDASSACGRHGLSVLPDMPEKPGLEDDFSAYRPRGDFYHFHLHDAARLDDRSLRSYVVQYNETDYAFVSRLLEEEGLSMVFSQIDQGTAVTITDLPRYEPFFAGEAALRLRSARTGDDTHEPSVWSLSETRRLRATSITVRDYDERRPRRPLEGRALIVDTASSEHLPHVVFPGRDEAVRENPDNAPAIAIRGRELTEKHLSEGRSNCRTLEPGFLFRLDDDAQARDASTWVVVSIEAYGSQIELEGTVLDRIPFGLHGTQGKHPLYENRFTALPEQTGFVPPRSTPRPRIDGVHTAQVTADELTDASGAPPEIHCNENGSVRLRFPWDERREPGAPSSCWVRVSQTWAGTGFGGMMIPRVGQEVLVAYLQGDPERPVVVGRVYNAVEPTPYPLPEAKTRSTWKSRSTPSSDGFNELRFEDAAGAEEIYLHAQRSLNEVVLGSHSESVGGDQSYSIGANQTFTVGENQVNTIGGRRSVFVTGLHYAAQADYVSHADGNHTFDSTNASFAVKDMFGVASARSRIYGTDHVLVRGDGHVHVDSDHQVRLQAGPAFIDVAPGSIRIDNGAGTSIWLLGGTISIEAPGLVQAKGSSLLLKGTSDIKLDGGAVIDAVAGLIKLNG